MYRLDGIPSEKTFQECLIKGFFDLEVDMVVLCKELTKLVGMLGRIESSTRELRLSLQVQVLPLSSKEEL